MSPNNEFDAAHATALSRWDRPFPGFTSGHDRRTSDRGMVILLYGGLEHAARHEWLNAGRRLIDKTYVDMLWHVQGLTKVRTSRPEQIAASLDRFIVDTVRPGWTDLPGLSDDERLETSIAWVEQMAGQCFGSMHSEVAASRMLFFLVPMLPLFNFSRGHQLALAKLGHAPDTDDYRGYAKAANSAYRTILARLRRLPLPDATAENDQNRELIDNVLQRSDWWTRRVFDAYLRELPELDDDAHERLFACDDGGKLTTG